MSRIKIFIILAVALAVALVIGFKRVQLENSASTVEIAMDWSDFQAVARSYDYDQQAFLVALRRAGLTSLAVSEELGSSLNAGRDAFVISGQSLIDQNRLAPVADPQLAAALRAGDVHADSLYMTVYSAAAKKRYLAQLHLHFNAKSVRILRDPLPSLIAVRTQGDYFSSLGLGLPEEPLEVARRLGFLLVPRLQNDERFGAREIQDEFKSFLTHERVNTVIFFGIRNQVLGFPDHVEDTAAEFRRTALNFGLIETYDRAQEQKGAISLATHTVGQTVRVQAISKAELDKLDFDTIVARYLLGARERNIRVLYVRPVLHQYGDLSIQSTNVELIRQLAEGLRERDLRLGRASAVPAFRVNPLLVFIVTLATPAVLLLLMDFLRRPLALGYAILAFVADALVFWAGVAIHHELLVCKIIALAGTILASVLAVIVLARTFRTPGTRTFAAAVAAGIVTLATATGVSLAGASVLVGLLSTPLTMIEVERFSGVKAILLLPPLIVLAVYLFTRVFGREPLHKAEFAQAPVRVYQLLAALVLLAAGIVYLARSGNQSDIAPSTFELALRSKLTVLLSVRPRFKEFLVGFPAMMLLPALRQVDKSRFGWLFALAIAVGTSDMIDTFSHLHTPLDVSLLRLLNGAVVGIAIGIVLIALYRSRNKSALEKGV